MGISDPAPAQLLIPVPFLGTVNLWLLRGDPLTLVDTGPRSDEGLWALERQLRDHGVALEDLELLLLTHHHLDHTGLAGRIRERSGARVAALDATAAWGVGYHRRAAAERRFTETLLAAHGVPAACIADAEPFWEHIVRGSADYETDVVLHDGDTIDAGGRTLRVVHRPGHSTTDTLFVDDDANEAIVGDHLLATITSGAETTESDLPAGGRRRALFDYLTGLRLTAAMNLDRCFTGHGAVIRDPATLIDERFAFHSARLDRITEIVERGADTAFAIAEGLWSEEVAATQTVLAIWEVLGHLDILVNRGTLTEDVDPSGVHSFHPTGALRIATANR
ncbi:MAG TPA: MBL fold metallo-hydrolase [Gaiellaceae bacterium]|nr:MBL fold metallo-hydrolase [Gaiellaceae bacterium]